MTKKFLRILKITLAQEKTKNPEQTELGES